MQTINQFSQKSISTQSLILDHLLMLNTVPSTQSAIFYTNFDYLLFTYNIYEIMSGAEWAKTIVDIQSMLNTSLKTYKNTFFTKVNLRLKNPVYLFKRVRHNNALPTNDANVFL